MQPIRYRSEPDGEWVDYRCPVSGTSRFDYGEGDGKCRWLVAQRHAVEAVYGHDPTAPRIRWYALPGGFSLAREPPE